MKTFSLILLGMMMIALLGGTQDSKRVGEAYPLTICPVSKRPLGENPVVVILEDMPESSMNGREVKFCCGGCSGRFMSDKTGNMNKLDEVIVKDQLKVYPVTNCIVMPEDELADPRSPEAMEDKNVIIGNRLYRFCCKGCIRKFKKDPAKYIPKVDELIVADQMPRYPKTMPCLVTEAKSLPDPSGSEAKDCTLIVYKNRLVRLCCTRCNKKFEADPAKYIAKLDAAAIKAQKADYPLTTCVVTGGNLKASSPWFMIGDRAVTTCCGGCKGRAMKDPRGAVAKLDAAKKAGSKKTDA